MSYPFGKETPKSIYNWSTDVFGSRTALLIAGRASVELAEFAVAMINDHDRDKLGEELADVAIMLWQLAAAHNLYARPSPTGEYNAAAFSPRTVGLMVLTHFAQYLSKLSHKPKELSVGLTRALEALEHFAEVQGFELSALVDAKMKINRARTWAQTAPGHYQHSEKVAAK